MVWALQADGKALVGKVNVDFNDEAFKNICKQSLSVYDGYETIQGDDIQMQIVPYRDKNVYAIEITDNREKPTDITISLKTPISPDIHVETYSAVSTFDEIDKALRLSIVMQEKDTEFEENDFYCEVACTIAVDGRKTYAF